MCLPLYCSLLKHATISEISHLTFSRTLFETKTTTTPLETRQAWFQIDFLLFLCHFCFQDNLYDCSDPRN